MDGFEGSADANPGLRVLRQTVPWLSLGALLLTFMMIWTGFQISLRTARTLAPGSVVATATVEPTSTAVAAGTIAVIRVDGLWLRASPDAGSEMLSAVKKGARLDVLNRTDTWLRVKDSLGRIGWIANSTKSVEIRKK